MLHCHSNLAVRTWEEYIFSLILFISYYQHFIQYYGQYSDYGQYSKAFRFRRTVSFDRWCEMTDLKAVSLADEFDRFRRFCHILSRFVTFSLQNGTWEELSHLLVINPECL